MRYPILLILIPIVILIVIIFNKKDKIKFEKGSKIANTNYIKNTEYFKKKIQQYNFFKMLSFISFIVLVIFSTLLICRPMKVKTENINQYNRDIFLCMDVSASVDELNIELVQSLEETVKKLNGERFGISIFNTSSVVLVPLTDDYNYVLDTLSKIKESIKMNSENKYSFDLDTLDVKKYISSGTLEGSKERGSSLIGDGLASCAYSFTETNTKRTKLIIFSTDNELAGTPLVSLNGAAKISKQKDIKVYGIGTKKMKSKDEEEFRKSVQLTGGKFYLHSNDTVNDIVSDIESTSKSLLKSKTETKRYDIPEVPFILLLISFIGFIISSKKVLS